MVLMMAHTAHMPAIFLVVTDVALVLAHILYLGPGFSELALGHVTVDLALVMAHIAPVMMDVAGILADMTGFLLLRGWGRGLLGIHQRRAGEGQDLFNVKEANHEPP